uniref:Phosducin thioredoxin-like domain-containing protein n=1 Tax=Oryza brachyantha TaxID=4533 RepID=J3KX37_ORYBR
MADYHFVYKDVEGASTQVDADEQPKSKEWLDAREPDELEDLEDDLDDDRFLEQYRKMRLAELREAAKAAKFGSIVPITGSDFVREVSQAPPDVWVVEHLLFVDKLSESIRGNQIISHNIYMDCGGIAATQPESHLRSFKPALHLIQSDKAASLLVYMCFTLIGDCIPNYPDRNVPTILVYNNSAVKGTCVGLQKFGGKRCTPESVALALCQSDPVLNDGQGGNDSSRDNVIEGVRRKFIEKVVAQHEEREEEDDSD